MVPYFGFVVVAVDKLEKRLDRARQETRFLARLAENAETVSNPNEQEVVCTGWEGKRYLKVFPDPVWP